MLLQIICNLLSLLPQCGFEDIRSKFRMPTEPQVWGDACGCIFLRCRYGRRISLICNRNVLFHKMLSPLLQEWQMFFEISEIGGKNASKNFLWRVKEFGESRQRKNFFSLDVQGNASRDIWWFLQMLFIYPFVDVFGSSRIAGAHSCVFSLVCTKLVIRYHNDKSVHVKCCFVTVIND